MSNDDDDADRDVNDHSDDDDDDDAEESLIGGDVPVCKSCGKFGHRTHRDHRCPDHKKAHCGEQGHTKRFCPDVQCPHCDLLGHQSETCCHRSLTTNPTPNFPKYAAHQGTYLHAPAFIQTDQMTGQAKNARYGMQIISRSNAQTPQTPTSTFHTRLPQWMMTASNAISLSMTSKPTPAGRTPTVSSSSS